MKSQIIEIMNKFRNEPLHHSCIGQVAEEIDKIHQEKKFEVIDRCFCELEEERSKSWKLEQQLLKKDEQLTKQNKKTRESQKSMEKEIFSTK